MSIEISAPKNLQDLADYIASCNSQIEKHIGFCGENSAAVLDDIKNDFSDLSIENSFSVAYEDSVIVGVIGLDIDQEDSSAEVWGPFINNNDMELAEKLWNDMLITVPREIKNFKFFINNRNEFVESFLNNIGANFHGKHSLLDIDSKKFNNTDSRETINISENYSHSFRDLHDTVFANAYYNGCQILSRLNQNNRLLILAKNDTDIEGYAYVEIPPELQEADIEFIAVHPETRSKGLGKRLLHEALQTIFESPEINNVSLTVSHENIIALNLYKSAGFQEIYILNYFSFERA